MRTLLTFLVFLSFTSGFSQHLQKQITLRVVPNRKIVNTFFDKAGLTTLVYSDSVGTGKLKGGTFGGFDYIEFAQGLKLQTAGKEVPFKRFERFNSYKDGVILTTQSGSDGERVKFQTYSFEKGLLNQLGSVSYGSIETSATQVSSKNVVVDDLSEGYGSYYEIYDRNLKLLRRTEPSAGGYQAMLVTGNDKYVVAVTYINKDTTRIAIHSADSGDIIKSGELPITTDQFLLLGLLDDLIIFFGNDKLEAFDFSFAKRWMKPLKYVNGSPDADVIDNKLSILLGSRYVRINSKGDFEVDVKTPGNGQLAKIFNDIAIVIGRDVYSIEN